MHWIDELERQAAREESLFRAQLLREDVARLRKLVDLVRTVPDAEAFRRAGHRLGWAARDARIEEIGPALERLFEAVREAQGSAEAAAEARARDAWLELTRVRMERLVGCLATPVPKPASSG
jgi:hypothetical protein